MQNIIIDEKQAKQAYADYLHNLGKESKGSDLSVTCFCGATLEQRGDIESKFATCEMFCSPSVNQGLVNYGQCYNWKMGERICPYIIRIPTWKLFANKDLWNEFEQFMESAKNAQDTKMKKIAAVETDFTTPKRAELEATRINIVDLMKKEIVKS